MSLEYWIWFLSLPHSFFFLLPSRISLSLSRSLNSWSQLQRRQSGGFRNQLLPLVYGLYYAQHVRCVLSWSVLDSVKPDISVSASLTLSFYYDSKDGLDKQLFDTWLYRVCFRICWHAAWKRFSFSWLNIIPNMDITSKLTRKVSLGKIDNLLLVR